MKKVREIPAVDEIEWRKTQPKRKARKHDAKYIKSVYNHR